MKTTLILHKKLQYTYLIFAILYLFTLSASAQTWQWGRRGGGALSLNSDPPESVYSIVTDSQKNVYTLSYLGDVSCNVDGNTIPYYDDGYAGDVVLSSFSCDGSYRWSKVFGGDGKEYLNKLQIDAQDNIYVAGRLCNGNNYQYPARIGTDLILVQNGSIGGVQDNSIHFLAKFNSLGQSQWIKRPMLPSASSSDVNNFRSRGFSTDPQGNSYWLITAAPGIYCDGQFVANIPMITIGTASVPPFYMLKYDSNGNFVSGTYMDILVGFTEFYRNHNNGNFYFSGWGNGSFNIHFGSHYVTHGCYVTCLDANLQFLWMQEDSQPPVVGNFNIVLYGLAFDTDNNVYVGAMLPYKATPTSFMGVTNNNQYNPLYVFKINAQGNSLLWSSTGSSSNFASMYGAIAVRDNKVCIVDFAGLTQTWGTQSTTITTGFNQGVHPLVVVLDKNTGQCTGLHHIASNYGSLDNARSVAIDASGDILVGGDFGVNLLVGPDTLTTNAGSQDFFVAKLAFSPCSPLATTTQEIATNALVAFPNPAQNDFNICVKEACNYNVYSITGAIVQSGVINSEDNTINISKLASGIYNIQVITTSGAVSDLKVVKE